MDKPKNPLKLIEQYLHAHLYKQPSASQASELELPSREMGTEALRPKDEQDLTDFGCEFHRILVAVDHKKHAAIEATALLAKPLNAVVGIVYVLDKTLVGARTGYLYPDTLKLLRSEAKATLQAMQDSLRQGCNSTAFFREGHPAQEILDVANEFDADLIIIGTHRRGPLSRFFLGSVSQAVVRGSDCPVLLVNDIPETETDSSSDQSAGATSVALAESSAST